MKTLGDKNKSESVIAWKRFKSGNVLAASFWKSRNGLEITSGLQTSRLYSDPFMNF